MNNYTLLYYPRQLVVENHLSYHIERHPESKIGSLHENQRKVLGFIIKQLLSKRYMYMTHDTIAWFLGISRQSVIANCKRLAELGLISWRKRHKKSNIYRVTPFIMHNPDLIYRLSLVLPILGSFITSLIFAASLQKPDLDRGFTQYNITKEEFIKKRSLSISGRRGNCPYYFQRDQTLSRIMNARFPLAVKRLYQKYHLKLTTWELTQLAAFSGPALDKAGAVYFRQRDTINNPYRYLLKAATNFSYERNLPINREYSRELAQALGVSELNQGPITEVRKQPVPQKVTNRQSPQRTLPTEKSIKEQISSFQEPEKPAKIKPPYYKPARPSQASTETVAHCVERMGTAPENEPGAQWFINMLGKEAWIKISNRAIAKAVEDNKETEES